MLRLREFLFGGVDAVRLDTFRRLFALSFLLYMGFLSVHATEWLTAEGFHYTDETCPPGRAAPAPLLPAVAIPLFWAYLLVSVVPLVAGFRPRLFAWAALAAAVYVQLVDYLAEFTINKLFVVGFAVLALAPPTFRRGHGPVLLQSAWPVRVLQATLVVLYAVSGACKGLHGGWLTDPDLLWRYAQGIFRNDVSAWMLRVLPQLAWTSAQWAVLAFEVLAPALFLWRRTRTAAIVIGLLLHVGIGVTFEGLAWFSIQMCTFYVLFIDAQHLTTARNHLRRLLPSRAADPATQPGVR